MKMTQNKVFNEPKIIDYTNMLLEAFSKPNSQKQSLIYLVKYNDLYNSAIPKEIKTIYKGIKDHIDGEIIYLPREKSKNLICIVLYGKDKIKYVDKYLGALVNSKIKNKYWKLKTKLSKTQEYNFYLGWALNQYRFNKFSLECFIELSNKIDKTKFISVVSGIFYGKELINIPSSDMGPDNLEISFIDFANHHKLPYKIIKNEVIEQQFPLIYAVGKASRQIPRLLEFNYVNNKKYPLVVLVGKGVCYDTGGLDLKPSQYMRNMKKDMGGAASVLALSNIILESNLRLNLKVLIPTVDNDIGPNSMRPGDVFNSRSGITVEIGNTDAEGRLILADALHYADSFKPNILINFATLTGAARVALGPDLPAYFTHHEDIATLINKYSNFEKDPLWRLPLYSPYSSWLDSDVADICNISQGAFAGSITAALFLDKFVKSNTKWIHIDTYAWSDLNKLGHSKGGDILGVRSVFKFIKNYVNNL